MTVILGPSAGGSGSGDRQSVVERLVGLRTQRDTGQVEAANSVLAAPIR